MMYNDETEYKKKARDKILIKRFLEVSEKCQSVCHPG